MTHSDTTISILTHTALQESKRCLSSVLASREGARLILTANGNAEAAEYFEHVAMQRENVEVINNIQNLGFIGPSNTAFDRCETEFFVLLNDDAVPPPEWLDKMKACFTDDSVVIAGPGDRWLDKNFVGHRWREGDPVAPDYIEGSCMMVRVPTLRKRGECLFWRELAWAYCLSPETPILRSDLSWSPISEIKKGDCLVTTDEFPPGKKGLRRYKKGIVTKTIKRRAKCVTITMEDGRNVTCSLDHKWLSRMPRTNNSYKWRMASELSEGFRIMCPLNTWSTEKSYDAGWISGIFDGEGYIRKGLGVDSNFGAGFAQKDGLVLRRAMNILSEMNIPFTSRFHNSNKDGVYNVEINARRYVMELLGRIRPIRLLHKLDKLWENRCLRSRRYSNDLKIKSVTPAGTQDVFCLQTTTKTFIANGMVSHNCDDAELCLRMRALGYNIATADFILFHKAGTTARTVPHLQDAMRANFGLCEQKWRHYLRTRSFTQ